MKLFLYLILMLNILGGTAHAQLIWFGKKMSASKAEARWGSEPFDAKKFKDGDYPTRAKMAASLIKNKKQWIGRPLTDIREQLGSHDGYYFTDMVPAYLITWGEKKGDETWQIVFLPDTEYKVKELIIELNGSY